MKSAQVCRQPDHEEPRLTCGHPVPCPYHTVKIRLDKTPAEVQIPATAREAIKNYARLIEIAETIKGEGEQ